MHGEKRTSVSVLLRSGKNDAQMILQAVGVEELSFEVVEGAESPIQGWYSEDHHKKCPAPALVIETQNSKSMLVAWICYPLPPGANSDRLLIDSKCESSLSRLDFQVEYDGKSDEISIRNDPAARLSGETGFTSRVSVVRDGNGKWSNPVDQPGD